MFSFEKARKWLSGLEFHLPMILLSPFVQRLLVTLILLPVGLLVISLGGFVYDAFIILVLALAGWEYISLFRAGGLRPASVLVLLGVIVLAIARAFSGFESSSWALTLFVFASLTYHLFAYERGRDQAGIDFAVTVSALLYIGWIGSYFISLRSLPNGQWWVLLVLPSVWFADTSAYLVGKKFGRHHLSQRLSPKKTWEGYLAGIVMGTLGGALFAGLWQARLGPGSGMTVPNGILMGLVLSVLTLLGDLGESMIKRQVGMKDSGNLLPGHGGIFDRIDSWLWAAVIGYYLAVWFQGG